MQITRSDLLRLCPNASAGILDGIMQYGPGMLPLTPVASRRAR